MSPNSWQHTVDSYRSPHSRGFGDRWRSDGNWRESRTQRSRSPPRANTDSTRENRAPSGPVSSHRRHDSGIELTPSVGQTPASPATTTPPPRRGSTRPVDVDNVNIGFIFQLPKDLKVGEESPSALLRRQLWMNNRAVNHPVLVWDVTTDGNTGEKVARCLQMTSFGGQSVEEKYNRGANAWKMHLQYVPVQQGEVPVRSATNMPSLVLENGQSMAKQTYAHIDHYFDIEARYLMESISQPPMRLTYDSLCVVTHKLDQFVCGLIYRNRNAHVKSPLDRDNVTRLRLTDRAQERSDEGRVDEEKRLNNDRLYEWRGYERQGPSF